MQEFHHLFSITSDKIKIQSSIILYVFLSYPYFLKVDLKVRLPRSNTWGNILILLPMRCGPPTNDFRFAWNSSITMNRDMEGHHSRTKFLPFHTYKQAKKKRKKDDKEEREKEREREAEREARSIDPGYSVAISTNRYFRLADQI